MLGPCYCFVASGIPIGWRRGCLAAGLVRSAVCHYCFNGCSALPVCAGCSQQGRGCGAAAGAPIPPNLLPTSLAPLAVRVAGCPVRVPLSLAGWYAVPRGLCVPRARSSCPSGSRRMLVVCVRASSAAVCALSLLVSVTRALRAVRLQRACRALPGGCAPPLFPALVRCSAYLV